MKAIYKGKILQQVIVAKHLQKYMKTGESTLVAKNKPL